ncbi:MAG: metallophosphoesterase [Prevotellaceae bacterium]|nr:metallophosphoesterase [Candidatus Minthosoma caballi]
MKLLNKKKKASLIIVGAVAVALACLVAVRWNVWFGIPDEPPYAATGNPCRIMLTLGDSTELSRNVSWQCGDEVREAWLELKQDEDSVALRVEAVGEVYVSRSGKAAYYYAKLRNLEHGRTYQYRVATDGKFSPWHEFSTMKEGEELSFMYLGDVQDTIGGRANAYLRQALSRNRDAQLLMCGGDLVERPADVWWQEAFDDLDSVRQSMPVMCIAGNHDYMKTLPDSTERRFSLVFSYFLDSHLDESLVNTFSIANAQFFLLDSNASPKGLWMQRVWFSERLAESKAKWKIVLLHHPLYSICGSMNNLMQRSVFDDLLRDNNVDLVLQGHEHAYARMTAEEDEKTAPVYVVSHCSPKKYRIEFDDRYDKYGISSRYYQMVRTHGDTLSYAAYDAPSHSLYDSLLVVKRANKKPKVVDLGRSILECMTFKGDMNKSRDKDFYNRIMEYCSKHPERISRQKSR